MGRLSWWKGQKLGKAPQVGNDGTAGEESSILSTKEGMLEEPEFMDVKNNKIGRGGKGKIEPQVSTARVTPKYRPEVSPSPKLPSPISAADIRPLLPGEKSMRGVL